MPCALAARCQNQNDTVAQNISQYTFSPFPCHWLGAHVMCSGGLVSNLQQVNQGQNKLTMYIFSFPGHWLGAHVMCSGGAVSSAQCTFSPFPCHWLEAHVMRSGVVVSKPQGEPGTKPARNAHFLHSRVISLKLMSNAQGAWCRKY